MVWLKKNRNLLSLSQITTMSVPSACRPPRAILSSGSTGHRDHATPHLVAHSQRRMLEEKTYPDALSWASTGDIFIIKVSAKCHLPRCVSIESFHHRMPQSSASQCFRKNFDIPISRALCGSSTSIRFIRSCARWRVLAHNYY